MDGRAARRGPVAIAAAAVGYGVDTALSVVALHSLRPADLLTIELGGSAAVRGPTAAGSDIVGNLLVLASVLGGAGYVVWSRRTAQPAEEGVGRTAWQFLGATLAVLPFVVGSWWTGGSRIGTAEPHVLVV